MTRPKFSGSTLVDENGTEVGQFKDVIYDSTETRAGVARGRGWAPAGEHVAPG